MSAESSKPTGDKAVERFDCTSGGAQYCNGCYTMTPDSEGEYVRHEDYAKLEQQRDALEDRVAALVEALKKVKKIHTATCWERRWSVEESPVIRTVNAALKAAGVVL